MTLWRVHHGIMKADAMLDYEIVLNYCKKNGLPIITYTKPTCRNIENATAYMINNISNAEEKLKLYRGISFYRGIYKEINKEEK